MSKPKINQRLGGALLNKLSRELPHVTEEAEALLCGESVEHIIQFHAAENRKLYWVLFRLPKGDTPVACEEAAVLRQEDNSVILKIDPVAEADPTENFQWSLGNQFGYQAHGSCDNGVSYLGQLYTGNYIAMVQPEQRGGLTAYMKNRKK